MQYISFQCKQCGSEVKYNPSQIEVPIGSGMRCPFCGAHYVLELIPINKIRSGVNLFAHSEKIESETKQQNMANN